MLRLYDLPTSVSAYSQAPLEGPVNITTTLQHVPSLAPIVTIIKEKFADQGLYILRQFQTSMEIPQILTALEAAHEDNFFAFFKNYQELGEENKFFTDKVEITRLKSIEGDDMAVLTWSNDIPSEGKIRIPKKTYLFLSKNEHVFITPPVTDDKESWGYYIGMRELYGPNSYRQHVVSRVIRSVANRDNIVTLMGQFALKELFEPINCLKEINYSSNSFVIVEQLCNVKEITHTFCLTNKYRLFNSVLYSVDTVSYARDVELDDTKAMHPACK